MKYVNRRLNVASNILFAMTLCGTAQADSTGVSDKLLHFGVSSMVGGIAETYMHYNTEVATSPRLIYSTIIGSVPGLIKEVYDSSRDDNQFSGGDMAANVAGALTGAIISHYVNNTLQVRINVSKGEKSVNVAMHKSF